MSQVSVLPHVRFDFTSVAITTSSPAAGESAVLTATKKTTPTHLRHDKARNLSTAAHKGDLLWRPHRKIADTKATAGYQLTQVQARIVHELVKLP